MTREARFFRGEARLSTTTLYKAVFRCIVGFNRTWLLAVYTRFLLLSLYRIKINLWLGIYQRATKTYHSTMIAVNFCLGILDHVTTMFTTKHLPYSDRHGLLGNQKWGLHQHIILNKNLKMYTHKLRVRIPFWLKTNVTNICCMKFLQHTSMIILQTSSIKTTTINIHSSVC